MYIIILLKHCTYQLTIWKHQNSTTQ